MRALPGVNAVGAISELPLTGQGSDDPFHIPGRVYRPSEFDDAQLRQVTPGYLSAMGIPLMLGRWLNHFDTANSPRCSRRESSFRAALLYGRRGA